MNGSRRKPRFYLTMWTVCQRTIEHLSRTNKAIEGFHRGFESMLRMFGFFLEAIRRQQALRDFTWQNKKGKHKAKENENPGRIKPIVCAAHENKPL